MIKAEPVYSAPIDPDDIFQALENDRKSGVLQNTITNSVSAYQASIKYPGYLEKIDSHGGITIGQFENGQFNPLNGCDI